MAINKLLHSSSLLILVFWVSSGSTQDNSTSINLTDKKLTIGLALSGGGARGAAHIGVLKKLDELNILIDYIAGTSMGALVGGLYASGLSPEEIEVIINEMDWGDILSDTANRENRSFRRKRDDDLYLVKSKARLKNGKVGLPSGIVVGQKIDFLLRSLTLDVSDLNDFGSLETPFKAVATDIVTGDAVVLESGDLALALRASMSIPAIFTPIEINGQYLVDGGVANNLPIDVVRSMGADIIIAVDISSPLLEREELANVFNITDQLTGILTKKNSQAQIKTLTDKDILIAPDLQGITMMDFERATEAMTIGYQSAQGPLTALTPYSDSTRESAAKTSLSDSSDKNERLIDNIRIDNNSKVDSNLILANLSVNEGELLDIKKIEKDISLLYGWQLFENIRYDIKRINNESHLIITVDEKKTGISYLQFGMKLFDDFSGENDFDLAVAYTHPYINDLRGEFRAGLQIGNEPRLGFELYQPLDKKARYFISPQISYQKQNVLLFDANAITSEFDVESVSADLSFGYNIKQWGELKSGFRFIDGQAKIRIGDPNTPKLEFENSEAFVSFTYDQLNNLNFPTNGVLFNGEFKKVYDGFGLNTDDSFNQLGITAVLAQTWQKNTVIFKGLYGTTFNNNAPIQNLYTLGGFSNLSGFGENELSGQHRGLVSGVYLRKISENSLLPVYVGGSIELGNVWQLRNDISLDDSILAGSLFVGVDSLIGPIYVAYGQAEGGNGSYYLYLGGLF
ncbi:MAG: patatin-like phospholipase family protein [Marinicella sp.]